MQFRMVEGHTIERELAPVFVATDGFTGGDNVVMAEPGDMEVMGAHTLVSLVSRSIQLPRSWFRRSDWR
jgi:hypothetical protein